MKNLTLTLLAALFLTATQANAQSGGAETLKQFVSNIPALASESTSSIAEINKAAQKKAAKTIDITQATIAAALKEAQGFKVCLLIVENHTIVKFSDLKKCSVSGSWGVCMPYGDGYIQNGSLTPANDYINNIIGKPDTQKRTLYLFN